MSLHAYIIRRIIFIIPIVFGITFVAFLLTNAIPSDPINANLPQNALNNAEIVNAFRDKWGLDKPLAEQYLTYLGNLVRGDMGTSIKSRKPVREEIQRYLPATTRVWRSRP
jgi:peptide/nickel transport system permease protein